MNVKIKLYASLIFIFLVNSCVYYTPDPVYRLKAKSNESSFWENGREFQNLKDENLEINVSYDRVKNGLIFFDLIVTNTSNKDLIVDHQLLEASFNIKEKIYEEKYSAYNQSYNKVFTGEYNEFTKTEKPINPENIILNLERKIRTTESRYKSAKDTNSSIEFWDAIGDLITIGIRTSEETEQDRLEDQRREESNRREEERYERDLLDLNKEIDSWVNESIRKTTLIPGDVLSGKIYFEMPINIGNYLILNIPNRVEKLVFNVLSY